MTTPVPGVDLRPDHWAIVRNALRRHVPDREVVAFGSRATWTAKDYSDLDLAVMGEEPLSLGTTSALDETLGDSDLPFKVDVVDWARIDEGFRSIIRRHGVVVQGRGQRPEAGGFETHSPTTPGRSGKLAEWTRTTLGELLSFSNGKLSPPRSELLPHPVYGSNGVIGFADKSNAGPNTIIIGRVGTYCGSLHYSDSACWVTDNAIRATAIGRHKPRFLRYLLRTLRLNARRTGSGQPLLNQTILSEIPVVVPHPREQRAIAHVLGTLDDKIELNRRMNETLEALARALFRSWFVDFDPVRAKMEGRDAGLPDHFSDLFPDRLVDSELGFIPEDWRVTTLGDLIELAYGKSLPRRKRKPGNVPVYGSNGQVGWHDERLIDGPGIIVGRKGNPGVVKWSQKPFFPIDTTFYVVPRDTRCGLFFLFHLLRTQDLPSIASDSAVPGMNRNLAYMNRAIVPPADVVEAFSTKTKTISRRQDSLTSESRTLADLRDSLLPKLISGEVRVPDAERVVASVT